MLDVQKTIRSLGVGGLIGGALGGILFLAYRKTLSVNADLGSLILIMALLGAGCYSLLRRMIIKPFSYYSSLIELRLLRRQIGDETRAEIARKLTVRYFLGDNSDSE